MSADAELIEPTVTSMGKVVQQHELEDLPLNGRNFSQLGLLQPGVVPLTPGDCRSGRIAAQRASLCRDQHAPRKFHVDRARCWHLFLRRGLPGRVPACGRHSHRKQGGSFGSGLNQLTSLKCPTPTKQLVRVHTVGSRNLRHAGTRLKRQLHHAKLLGCNACRRRGRFPNNTPTESTMTHSRSTLDYMPEGNTTRLRNDCRYRERYAEAGNRSSLRCPSLAVAFACLCDPLHVCYRCNKEFSSTSFRRRCLPKYPDEFFRLSRLIPKSPVSLAFSVLGEIVVGPLQQ